MGLLKSKNASALKAGVASTLKARGQEDTTPPDEVQLSSLMYIDRDPVTTLIDDSPDDFTVTLA